MIYDLNGKRVSLTDASISVGSFRALGATGVKCSEKLEPGEVEGTSSIPVGYTDGPWSGTMGFSLPLAEAMRLQQSAALFGGFGKAVLDGSFTFSAIDSSDGVNTIEMPSFRITSSDLDGGDRSKASMIAFEGKLLEPALWNGVRIIDPPSLTDGAAGFVLSIFGG